MYGGSSGFRGKGFHFDEAEAQFVSDKRRFAKAAMGLDDSDNEDGGGGEGSVDWDVKIEDMFATKRKVVDVSKSDMAAMGPIPGPAASTEA